MSSHQLLPRKSRRWAAVAALVVTAGTHASLVPEHLREAPYAGALFIALTVAALALAVHLFLSERAANWAVSGGVCLAALVAYVVSRSVGLPSLGDDVGDWFDPLGVVAITSEALVVVLSALYLRRAAVAPLLVGGARA